MAIAPTGTIYKSLVFDGESSRDYGIYITGAAVYNAPERDVEMISIPGRNGAFALDKGRFENIEVSYPAGIFADTETDFAEAISDFRNYLCSRKGYVRLTDEYNPNEFRMAVYKSGLEVSPAQLKAGEFNIVFDCMPQRYLTSGEEAITIGEWGDTETAEGTIAEFEAVEGDGVKSLVVDIEPVQSGSGTPSPDNVRPISGYDSVVVNRTGKNLCKLYEWTGTGATVQFSYTENGVTLNGTATQFTDIPSSGAVPQNGIFTLKAGTYKPSTDNANVGIQIVGLNPTEVLSSNGNTFTLASDRSVFARASVYAGRVYNNLTVHLQLEAGSTATDYEPYQGNTYTTNLNGTRYGGTLDVVSGVLTVDRAFITLDGSSDEVYTDVSASTVKSILYTPTDAPKTYVTAAIPPHNISNYLASRSRSNISGNLQGFAQYNNGLRINIVGLTTVDEYRAYFVNNPLQIVYELATPQTVQLTAQQVSAIVGTNNIWANSGDVSVEYGQDPNVVINPTLFEARPMLEVEGYGNININGYEITRKDTTLGLIQLEGWRTSVPLDQTYTLTFDKAKLNVGDTIYFSANAGWGGIQFTLGVSYAPYGAASVSWTDSNADAISTGANSFYYASPVEFVIGTPKTITNTKTITATIGTIGTTETATWTGEIAYDGDRTFTVSCSSVPSANIAFHSPKMWHGTLYGDSTVSDFGTVYIDCDLGEAYAIIDSSPASANAIVNLGSDLPTLVSGANEITYDNTITELKITPRWWKV